jgi:hypothetical protein
MLAINKITFKTKEIYEKIRQIYLENVDNMMIFLWKSIVVLILLKMMFVLY